MIPNRMVFFWAGQTMAWMRFLTLRSFRLLNPDWQVELYHWDAPVDRHRAETDYLGHVPGIGIDVRPWSPSFDHAGLEPAQLSDLFQWDWLAGNDGWYADNDIIWTEPAVGIAPDDAEVAYSANQFLQIGLLGVEGAGREYFFDIFQTARSCLGTMQNGRYELFGKEAQWEAMFKWVHHEGFQSHPVGRPFLADFDQRRDRADAMIPLYRRLVKMRYPGLEFFSLPQSVVYPIAWNDHQRLWQQYFPIADSRNRGIHWFGGGPESREAERRIGPDNIGQEQGTVANAIRRHLCDFPL